MTMKRLLNCLYRILDIYAELARIGLDKSDVLSRNRLDDLQRLTAMEEQLLERLAEQEKLRKTVTADLKAELGVPEDADFALSDIRKWCKDAEVEAELERVQTRLAETARSLRRTTEMNQQLLRLSLDFVESSMDSIFGPRQEEVTYHHPRINREQPRRTGGLDYRT